MARPKNPNAKPRKPREARTTDVGAQLQQIADALTNAAGSLLTLDSLDAASVAIIQLNALSKQAKEMQRLAEFIRSRYQSEAELQRKLEEATAPKTLNKKPAALAAE